MTVALDHTGFVPKQGIARTVATAIGAGVAIIVAGEAIWITMIAVYKAPDTISVVRAGHGHGDGRYGGMDEVGTLAGLCGAAARRDGVRLNPVPLKTFLLALLAGWSTFFAGAGLYVAYRMQSGLGGEVPMTLPPGPKAAVIAGLAMAAIVAGVLEEISVRGFIQGRLEKAYGVVPAIVVSGLVWALFHTNHSYFDTTPLNIAIWFGIFLVVSAMLGTIAHRTNSVLPGIVVHAGFDATYFVSAGILQPKIAPLAYLESLAPAHDFAIVGAMLGALAVAAWIAFARATRR